MCLKTKFKILATKIIWNCSKIFYIFPLNNKKIIFLSYNGKQYSDSPKYISDFYLKSNNDLKQIWIFNRKYDIKKVKIPPEIIVCRKGTLIYLFHLFTAKEIVINDFISTAFKLRKGQILLNTWHGGGTFKTIGMTRHTISDYDEFFYKAHAKNTSAFSLSSDYFKNTVVTKSFLFFGETIKSGMPRNAVLFQADSTIRKKVFSEFNIESNNNLMIILYAPTYRNYTQNHSMDLNFELIDFDRCRVAFEKKFNKRVIILNRSHHIMHVNQVKGEYFDATNYSDMQELIITSDILISDYSSCMWDFALTKKPIFVYAPDLSTYEDNIDFFMPAKEWAFPLSRNNDELIENIIKYDKDSYQQKLKEYMAPLKSYEGENSVKITCEWLDRKRKENL